VDGREHGSYGLFWPTPKKSGRWPTDMALGLGDALGFYGFSLHEKTVQLVRNFSTRAYKIIF
jgi:hypothetical protein